MWIVNLILIFCETLLSFILIFQIMLNGDLPLLKSDKFQKIYLPHYLLIKVNINSVFIDQGQKGIN